MDAENDVGVDLWVLAVLDGALTCAVLRRSQMIYFVLAVSVLGQAVQNGALLELTGEAAKIEFGGALSLIHNSTEDKLVCSGKIQASDVVIEGTSTTVADLIGEVAMLRQDMAAVKQFVGMMPPPAVPPSLPPSLPPMPPPVVPSPSPPSSPRFTSYAHFGCFVSYGWNDNFYFCYSPGGNCRLQVSIEERVPTCFSACLERGYDHFGIEDNTACFCGNGAPDTSPASGCYGGDGGSFRMDIYTMTR